jgi:hypothetical protein
MISLFLCLAQAEPPTRSERDRAMSALHGSRKVFVDATAGLTEAQWNFKPSPEKWSIGEIAEHLALTEALLRGLVVKSAAGPADADLAGKRTMKDEEVLKNIATRDPAKPVSAPPMLAPQKKFATPAAAVAAFEAERKKTIAYIEKTEDDLRHHAFQIPGGVMDCLQGLFMIAAHTDRHVDQIREVKAAAGYPKR